MSTTSRKCKVCDNQTLAPSGLCHHHENGVKKSQNVAGIMGAMFKAPRKDPPPSATDDRDEKYGIIKKMGDHELRPEQIEAAGEAFNLFRKNLESGEEDSRCQVRAACGMGKTEMGVALIKKYDEHLKQTQDRHGIYLVQAPTTKLSDQLRKEFEANGIDPKNCVSVHHDATNANAIHGISTTDQFRAKTEELLERAGDGESEGPTVVFVVDSMQHVINAQQKTETGFDVTIFDEAHNLAPGSDSQSKENASELLQRTALFNDEHGETLASDHRMFLSASQKVKYPSDKRLSKDEKDIRETILQNTGKAIPVWQTDEEVFGKVVGSRSWGLRYAVEKGYLSKPEVEVGRSRIKGARMADRSTRVNLDGEVVPGGGKRTTLSVQEYAAADATIESIMRDGGGDVLVFADKSAEAQAISDNLAPLAKARMSARDPQMRRMKRSDVAAIVANPESHSPERVEAAKYRMIADNLEATAVYSGGGKDVDDRRQFFDDPRSCKCGKVGGGWCACARVLSNVKIFGEGISVNSIERVVYSKNSVADSIVMQAMGRASRLDRNNPDKKAKFIVPLPEGDDGPMDLDGRHHKVLGSVSRVWRDTDAEHLGFEGDVLPPSQDLQVDGVPISRYVAKTPADPRAIKSVNTLWSGLERSASQRFKKETKGSRKWTDLTADEQYNRTIEEFSYVFNNVGPDGRSKLSRSHAADSINSGVATTFAYVRPKRGLEQAFSPSRVQFAKAYASWAETETDRVRSRENMPGNAQKWPSDRDYEGMSPAQARQSKSTDKARLWADLETWLQE